MPYISLDNLTRYDGKIKEYAEDNFASVEALNWQKTEKAGAAAFYPVPETALEPVVDFLFTETGPAEGTKGPDNPSTITGVSNVTVTRCGKNLVRNLQNTTYRGVAFTANVDGSITVNRISSNNNHSFLYISPLGTLKTGLTYSLSGCPSGGSGSTYYQRFGNNTSMDTGSGLTAEILASPEMSNGLIRIDYRYSPDDLVFWPQIELGSEITSFEKSEYEDYTIDLGGTYYGGSLDVATGVMTVTWEGNSVNSFTTTEAVAENTVAFRFRASTFHVASTGGNLSCSNFAVVDNSQDIEHCRFSGTGSTTDVRFYINKSRLDVSGAVDPSNPTNAEWLAAANAWVASNPGFVVFRRATPTTVQLTPLQIYSLSQPDPYTPRLNTVYSDQTSVQVGYPKSPQASQNELTNAIVSLGGNL